MWTRHILFVGKLASLSYAMKRLTALVEQRNGISGEEEEHYQYSQSVSIEELLELEQKCADIKYKDFLVCI